MSDEIKMPHHIAEMICKMEEVCFSEGQGPDNTALMLWISETYPDLKKKYSYLQWPEGGRCE